MKSIGVRELKKRLSEVLRDVRSGETLEVTIRGEVVARLVPPPGTTDPDTIHKELRDVEQLAIEIGRTVSARTDASETLSAARR